MKAPEDPRRFAIPVLKASQPIGDFFIGVIGSKLLCQITRFDVRRILKERDVETYLGIQRPLDPRRVSEIEQYVSTVDACFPTAVILAVDGRCATYDEKKGLLTLSNYLNVAEGEEPILFGQIAQVLDGQHRIEGLKDYKGSSFDVNVCIFVEMDIAEQAYIFSTVNLAQTKVKKSLVYDLFDLAKTPSPQKLCHNIAVALDGTKGSPFYQRIKRLGVATEGRYGETLTQATVVESLLKYISKNPMQDRDIYKKGGTPQKASAGESKKLIFRNMMIENRGMEIADVLWNYFSAVAARWPQAWASLGGGMILNKTNGFRGLMRFLPDVYLYLTSPGNIPSAEDFGRVFRRIPFPDDYFDTDTFKPGSSGEAEVYRRFKAECPFLN